MLKIGEFSKLSRVSIRMLRHYDEIGLLKPAYIDPDSGYRYYAEHQLTAAGRITALKDMGFGLSSMAQILACDSKEMLASHMLVRQAELEEQIHLLSDQLRRLDTALTRLRKDETMQYDVTVKTFPARCAATVRMQIPSYEMEGNALEYAGQRNAIPEYCRRQSLLLLRCIPRQGIQGKRCGCGSIQDCKGQLSRHGTCAL